jgi:hypothetical protein
MLIDRFLNVYDAACIAQITVDAPRDVVWAAIRETDLRDPVVDTLFTIRELPDRLIRRLRGEAPPPVAPRVTFADMETAGPGWVPLGEDSGREFVVGSVGRFWRRDYGGRSVNADEFVAFHEPGYAKLAISLSVRALGYRTLIHYEARTATTDLVARRKFLRYWKLVGPGAGLVMRRALRRIKAEAESRAAALELLPAAQ